MRLSLIGMSGSGKSSWSIKLSELGFKRFCCDDMITEKLDRDLTRPDGTCMKLGEWMGFPYEPHYEEYRKRHLYWRNASKKTVFMHKNCSSVNASGGPGAYAEIIPK